MKREPPPQLTDPERLEIALTYQRKMREQNSLFAVWIDRDRLFSRGAPWEPLAWVPWLDAMHAIEWRGLVVIPERKAPEQEKPAKTRKHRA